MQPTRAEPGSATLLANWRILERPVLFPDPPERPRSFVVKKRSVAVVLSLSACGMLVGCGSSSDVRTSEDVLREVRDDPTPGLRTLAGRPADTRNQSALNLDVNRRLFWEDLRRFTLNDRPSHLAPQPVPQR